MARAVRQGAKRHTRRGDAGVTLIEVLAVLALIGVLSGAVALSLGAAERGGDTGEASRLAARLDRAVGLALARGEMAALSWDASSHDFELWSAEDDAWGPHDDPVLAARGGPAEGAGRVVIGPLLLPPEGGTARIALRGGGVVLFDGLRARVERRDG